ncbi:MAG: 3-oxoacyl-[acyl-carrier-protein] reductase [Phycisphaeraceae bacterium]|nr:3-oxoacyl-[acyl-carrier-protein] reductase [Phycisphaerales bacterium]MCB9842358.1 3-oxoacyl-[acyl-carrier-protein] reductase [Phycisphaeraceae bacterium]
MASETSEQRRVAVVTGASRGIGKAIATRLAADGRHVVLVSRSAGPLSEVRSEIEQAGGVASIQAVDVGDLEAFASAIESIASELGRLDILVNNAGITRDNLSLRMTNDEFMEVIRVNLASVFVACRAAARPMMRQKFGRIVNIGSTSGVVGNAGQANYAAAKSGLSGLTKSLARELGGKAITANVIAPGFIETDMTSVLGDEIKSRVMEGMALRRLGRPEDIAAAVAYVSSDEAGFLTGQVISVDGGLTMC